MKVQLSMIGVGLIFASGCAGMNPQLRAKLDVIGTEPVPVCDAKTCPEKWARAQVWLTRHARMKLQTATDSVLQTYNVTNGDPVYSYTITKEPNIDGTYRITVDMVCGNIVGCVMKEPDIKNILYHYLNTGEDIVSNMK